MSVAAAPRAAYRVLRRATNRIANLCEAPILVLAYHRVTTLDRDIQSLAVQPERFRAQMRALKHRYEPLRLDRPWPRLSRPGAIVTFDDGYADNATEALPILESEEVPVTFFVSTGAIEAGREFWWDELERWLLAARAWPSRIQIEPDPLQARKRAAGAPGAMSFPTGTEAERVQTYRELHAKLRNLPPDRRERLLASVRTACGGDTTARPSHRPLTPAEVARLGGSPWGSVGAHGVTHTPFASLSTEDQAREMAASRSRLQAWTGAAIDTFSFPFGGRGDFTETSVRLAREAGFRRIAANVPGQARRWADPYVVPRFLVRDWDGDRFEAELRRFEVA
ncbi:MAG: polysaccharide deacetylase family protein [Candidatus Eiseniibacteriota bacterium]